MFVAALARYPLVAFFALAYAISWVCVALTPLSLVFGFFALFGPAVAALVVTGAIEGRRGVSALLARLRIWRVGVRWYLVALGLPALLSVAAVGLGVALGAPREIAAPSISPLTVTLFVLVIGEEVGWRGFALPRLNDRLGPLTSSLALGLAWAAWHLPNQLIPGLEAYGYGFPAFASYVLGMTVLFTLLATRTSESLLIAWLFHGAINTLIFINPAIPIDERWWHNAVVYAPAAVLARFTLRSRGHLGESAGQPVG